MNSVVYLLLVAVLAVGLAGYVEIAWAACLPFYVWLAYGAVCTVVVLPLLLYHRSKRKWNVYGLFLITLVLLWIFPWNTRKSFLRDFAKIKAGMTEEQVEGIMGGYIKGTGWMPPPDEYYPEDDGFGPLHVMGSDLTLQTFMAEDGQISVLDSIVFRHSEDGRFNADWGVIRFEEGKVVQKIFLPD